MTRKASKERRKTITDGTASEISPAAELIASNVDLLTEILLRLPARSLIRFKCVSKHWLSLISHSQFANNHSSRNPRPSISGLYFYFRGRLLSVSLLGCGNLPSLSFCYGFGEQSKTRVQHSCNGLLLLCYNGSYNGHIRRQFIVCNPTTKEQIILPSSQICQSVNSCAYLAFDPSKSPHYKVLYFDFGSSRYISAIYCSQSSCWKQLTISRIDWRRGVFWNGAIHQFDPIENSFTRFDIDTEEVIVMPNPQMPQIIAQDKTTYFGESGGCLFLIHSTLRDPLEFRILEIDKHYCGWIVKCQFDLTPLVAAFPEMKDRNFFVLKVLPVAKGDKGRDFALVLAIPGRIVSYDLTCKTWDVLHDRLPRELDIYCTKHHIYPFIVTLFHV